MNKLILAQTISERINPTIEHMCAVGVDEMSWDDLNEAHYDCTPSCPCQPSCGSPIR